MQFRWLVGITLWTILSGPIFAPPQSAQPFARSPHAARHSDAGQPSAARPLTVAAAQVQVRR